MIRVRIELWMELSAKLDGDFEKPSDMRSLKTVETREGSTVREVLSRLACAHPILAEKVFDLDGAVFDARVVVLYNDRVIARHGVEDLVLKDGDRITIVPIYAGG